MNLEDKRVQHITNLHNESGRFDIYLFLWKTLLLPNGSLVNRQLLVKGDVYGIERD